jgi:hypothetical protein
MTTLGKLNTIAKKLDGLDLQKSVDMLKRSKKMKAELNLFMDEFLHFIFDPSTPKGFEDLHLDFKNSADTFFDVLERKLGK